ncbi:anti-sigma factor [Pinibacter soli]|uniref:Anti-sigma factor n=1 Tax=Pinibacter soli TaxID=3044211 RepID=A0ABT6RCJ0_9BACT|nr:anti-sigma factor [Pinibacter soli]MDI3320270.1 anti-sigma factor [Pinibacter soli]
MNIQEYIQSGIIESYVLGLASEEERLEFESVCATYPEVVEAREALELSLEHQAVSNAVTPPAYLKDKIRSAIGGQQASNEVTTSYTTTENDYADEDQPLIIRKLFSLRSAAAAAIILLGASTLLNFYFYRENGKLVKAFNDLSVQHSQLVNNNQSMQAKLQDYAANFEHIRNPRMKAVKLPGVSANSSSMCTVYWDMQTKDVYLMVNNLPKPATGMQYQLWAMVDGKPVDAGMLDMDKDNMVVKMKNIPSATAFAVTLEKKGGSPTPDMNAMYVMGTI